MSGRPTSAGVGHMPVIILSSFQAALDLLDKRGSIYSDRPEFVMAGSIVGYAKTVVLSPYGDRLHEARRMFLQCIGTRSLVEGHAPLMERATHEFLLRTLRAPERFRENIRRMTSSTMLLISHGYQVEDEDDRFLHLADRVTHDFAELAVLPALQYIPAWLPGTAWQETAATFQKTLVDSVEEPFAFVTGEIKKGTAISSLASRHLEAGESKDDVKYAAMSLYSAGSGTTVSALCSFFLAMTLYPDVQRKAQAEIDAVIGPEKLPNSQDFDHLPYVRALCLEVLRWLPVAPLGVPHRLQQDDTYKGWLLPRGSIVMVINWKLLHDPDMYQDAMEFNPERFLPNTDKGPELDPSTIAFGYGRRICPGMQVAQTTIFRCVSQLLAVFDITTAFKDDQKVIPDVGQRSGIISHPLPFTCSIKPRSTRAEAIIRAVNNEQ